MFLIASVLIGLWFSKPTTAQAPQSNSQDYTSGPLVIKDNAILRPIPISPNDSTKLTPPMVRRDNASPYEGQQYSKEEVIQLIKDYSQLYGISPDLSLRIANCESGYAQFSKNRNSSASGVFQYLSNTWRNTEAGRLGISVFDAEQNIKMAVSSIAANGTAPWNASIKCWNK